MNPKALRDFANGVVALSALDGFVSLLDELLRAATGAEGLGLVRAVVAQLALVAVLGAIPVAIATPRLPLVVFGPLAAVTLWLTLGAAPLGLWIASPARLGILACVVQLAAVALALVAIRRHNGGRAWWFDAASPPAPAFAWRRALALTAALCAIGPPAVALYGVVAMATWIEVATHGFLHFDLGGVSLADRRYARGDQEIRLVGMMHIGEESAYRALVRSFARESTIVLAEGVSDRSGQLAGDLQYGHAAQALGLSPQRDLRDYLASDDAPQSEASEWPVVRYADVDASAFSPETIDWIRWASRIWSSEDLASALLAIAKGMRERGPEDVAAFQADILDLRNAHLTAEIAAALGEYERIVVPWGALHLPAIEDAVRSWGFEETSRERHALIAWRTVAAALF